RLGPRLQEEQPSFAVDRPLQVLGPAVVLLDRAPERGELFDLGRRETGLSPALRVDLVYAVLVALDLLRADLRPHELARHLRAEERVRRDIAPDDGYAEAVARVDRDRRAVAGHRVEREHDAGHACIDHLLDGDAHSGGAAVLRAIR